MFQENSGSKIFEHVSNDSFSPHLLFIIPTNAMSTIHSTTHSYFHDIDCKNGMKKKI